MLPAGPYSPSVMRSSWEGDVALLRRGVTIAAIYPAESARTPEMLRYLAEFAKAGAKVRVTRMISHRTIIVDRQVAALAVEPDTLKLPYLLVREPALVRNIRAEFAALWRGAHSVGFGGEDTLADQTVRETWKCSGPVSPTMSPRESWGLHPNNPAAGGCRDGPAGCFQLV